MEIKDGEKQLYLIWAIVAQILTGSTCKQEASFLQNNHIGCCYSKVLVVDGDHVQQRQFQEQQQD